MKLEPTTRVVGMKLRTGETVWIVDTFDDLSHMLRQYQHTENPIVPLHVWNGDTVQENLFMVRHIIRVGREIALQAIPAPCDLYTYWHGAL